MASGHVNRTQRPNTWLHRPACDVKISLPTWSRPHMAHRAITLTKAPSALSEALQFTLSLQPSGAGQQIAQREITSALQNAMDARRQRLLLSQSQVTGIKWFCLYLQAVCALIAIALVHSDNRLASILSCCYSLQE